MRLPGLHRARAVVRTIHSSITPAGIILMYHRVAERGVDPWYLCVTPEHFAMHLEILRTCANPISLGELGRRLRGGKVGRRTVVVTFDDGYANNLHYAEPLLREYSTPATVFVTAGYIGANREYWWDDLDRALLRPGRLPDRLQLSVDGDSRQWDLGPAVEYSEEDHSRDCAHQGEGSPRVKFYYAVWEWLRVIPEGRRRGIIDEVHSWAGSGSDVRLTHRPLTADEVQVLGAGGLVEIGAHTMSHAMLSAESVESQREEIQRSKVHLERLLGHPVASFCYPFGAYTGETVSLVKDAGFSCACSVTKGRVTRQSDLFQLPRFGVMDWDANEFKSRLMGWFHGQT